MAQWGIFDTFFVDAVSLPGRVDGEQAAPKDGKDIRFFTPAGWAFAIWAPIFLGEALFAVYQALPGSASKGFLPALTPYWLAAMGFQSLWCAAFRPWAAAGRALWAPAALLAATAAALAGAHGAVRAHFLQGAAAPGGSSWTDYYLCNLPLSLHFGWITAATLVNANGAVANDTRRTVVTKSLVARASVAVAVAAGAAVAWLRRDPVYSLVVAWALAAVADEQGWGRLRGEVPDALLEGYVGFARLGTQLSGVVTGVSWGYWNRDITRAAWITISVLNCFVVYLSKKENNKKKTEK
mmetsp:Transcript_6768/g.10774  ORF Transcript_6768/g.10774 Transcript_6768/m.10774 type:complete len:296 (+) Transcript_6768:434-1321(+)